MALAEQLLLALRSLPSATKATDRKRLIGNIEDLLTKDNEDDYLALDSVAPNSKRSWKSVFEAMVAFVKEDLEFMVNSSARSSNRGANALIERLKEHVSVMRSLMHKMSSRMSLPGYAIKMLVNDILCLFILHQPYYLPTECVCTHIRLFETYVLNAGRRLLEINNDEFNRLFRCAVASCYHIEKSKLGFVEPNVRLTIAKFIGGLLRFAAEDLFQVRSNFVSGLYMKYLFEFDTAAEQKIAQVLISVLPDACRAMRDAPMQLKILIGSIFPKMISLFTLSCSKGVVDPTVVTSCFYIISELPNFVTEIEGQNCDQILLNLWEAAKKCIEDATHSHKYSGSGHHRRPTAFAKLTRAHDINLKCLIELYVAVAHFRISLNKESASDTILSSEISTHAPKIWLSIATKWLELYPMDLPLTLVSEWSSFAASILSKPSKHAMHDDALMLILKLLLSPHGTNLPSSNHRQLWNAVQKAFSPSTAETIFRIMDSLVDFVFKNKELFHPTVSIPIPQLMSQTSYSIPFLLKLMTYDPPRLAIKSSTFHIELFDYFETMGTELISTDGKKTDLTALSQVLLFMLSAEILITGDFDASTICPHKFFTPNDTKFNFTNIYFNEMHTACDLLMLSNAEFPDKLSSYWLNWRIAAGNTLHRGNNCSSCCPPEVNVVYVKLVDNITDRLEKLYPGSTIEEYLIKLNFLAHLALAGPLSKVGLGEYTSDLVGAFSQMSKSEILKDAWHSKSMHSYLAISARAKTTKDRQMLINPFVAASFIEIVYEHVFEAAKSFADISGRNSPTQLDKTAVIIEDADNECINENANIPGISRATCLKSLGDLPPEQIKVLTELRLLVVLMNLAGESGNFVIFEEKTVQLLKVMEKIARHRSRNVAFHCVATLCNDLQLNSPSVYAELCRLIMISLQHFLHDQHLAGLHFEFLRTLILQNHDRLNCEHNTLMDCVTASFQLYTCKQWTVPVKLSLLNLLVELASKLDANLLCLKVYNQETEEEKLYSLSSAILLFLSDESMTIRLAAVKSLQVIFLSSPINASLFNEFDQSLREAMRLTENDPPLNELEVEAQRCQRSATVLLALARLSSLQLNSVDFERCRAKAIALMITRCAEGFDPSTIAMTLAIATKWAACATRPVHFLEPLTSSIAQVLLDEEFSVENLMAIFYASEVIESGLLEALLINESMRSSTNVLEMCKSIEGLAGEPEFANICKRVDTVTRVLRCQDVTDTNFVTYSLPDLADNAVRLLVICEPYLTDDRILTRLFGCILLDSKSSSFSELLSSKRSFISFFMAALDSRLVLIPGRRTALSVDFLRIYVRVCRIMLRDTFILTKEADIILTHVFKTSLFALVRALDDYEDPCKGNKLLLKLLLTDLVIPAMAENAGRLSESNAKEYVAPIIAVCIEILSKSLTTKRPPPFERADIRKLWVVLLRCNATISFAMPFYYCLETFGSLTVEWLNKLTEQLNDPAFGAEICKHTRKCVRSLLRVKLDLKVTANRIINPWCKLADRFGDSKLSSLLFQLAIKYSAPASQLEIPSSSFNLKYTEIGAHNCTSRICLTPSRDSNVDTEEYFVQVVIMLNHLKYSLLYPSLEDYANRNYWPQLIEKCAAIITTIPHSIFADLPTSLLNFFAPLAPISSTKLNHGSLSKGLELQTTEQFENELWTCPTTEAYSTWLCHLTESLVKYLPATNSLSSALLKMPTVGQLISSDVNLAEKLLPRIVLLCIKNRKDIELLTRGFANLMKDALCNNTSTVLRVILDLVKHIRMENIRCLRHHPPASVKSQTGGLFCNTEIVGTTFPFSNALCLDWWHLAKAADLCGMAADVSLYGQLHFETNFQTEPKNVKLETAKSITITSASLNQLALESSKLSVLGRNFAAISLDDGGGRDVLAGLVSVSDWSQSDLRFAYYSLTHQWDRALGLADSSVADRTAQIRFNSGDFAENYNNEDAKYEFMWKLADWSRLPKCLAREELANPKPDVALFSALSALNGGAVDFGKTLGMEKLSAIVIQSSLNDVLKLALAPTIDKVWLSIKLNSLSYLNRAIIQWPEIDIQSVTANCKKADEAEEVKFLSAALAIIRTKSSNASLSFIHQATDAMFNLSSHLIDHGKPMLAAKLLRRFQPKDTCSENSDFDRLVRFVGAQAAWAAGETRTAIGMLGNLIGGLKAVKPNPFLQSEVSKLYAKYNMEANLANNANSTDTEAMLRSILSKNATNSLSTSDNIDINMAVARYAEHRLKSLELYMQSTTFERKRQLIEKADEDLSEINENANPQAKQNQPIATVRFVKSLEGNARIDKEDVANVCRLREQFLETALNHFLQALRHSATIEDIVAYRVVGMWFANETLDCVVKAVSQFLPGGIASAKFVPLFYQMAARYCAASSPLFSPSMKVLENLLLKITSEHPYHTLPVLLQLSTSDVETAELVPPAKNAKKQRIDTNATPPPSGNLASVLLNKLKMNDSELGKLIDAFARLRDAYVEFAALDAKEQGRGAEIPIPERFFKKPIFTLPLPLLTKLPNVQFAPSGDSYRNDSSFVTLQSIDRSYRLVGGINLPKLIRCRASDGRVYQQLVKGANDDLRQDAVMQQVFKVVNALFAASPQNHRPYVMRTYPIVPLCPAAGIIGFCDATIALGTYLVGDGKTANAHSYYRPTDWPSVDSRAQIQRVQHASREKRVEVFRQIYANFKPVFRFYFIENFPDPVEFCRRRRSYSVSAAVASMVGHILGLGDRHLQNILLDLQTSELVHIDLGVAFEQGRTLSIPETVPFRLTRDIIDGMGPTGVEGIFRKTAESALSILQKNRETIMTVLEVFNCDPLYNWTINPLKKKRLQENQGALLAHRGLPQTPGNRAVGGLKHHLEALPSNRQGSSGSENQIAKRVLLQVDQKLVGEISECGAKLSVPEQVEWLIQQAAALDNLALIYCGWQAHV